MESKKISQLATELTPDLSDLTIIGDPTTGISKKITLSQMASLFTGTVEEYANLAAFPLVGVADTIYVALDTNIIYRYDTSLSTYVVLSPNIINSLVFSDANGFDGTITLVGSVATLSITTALTSGSVPFIGASGALTQDNANLFFDDTNNRLGIATASPTTPLDVFGSGIIGRLNATSTNNAYLGFASNGTNKWSAGNVQSDHRFRIFSEANSAELISVLQTGEFGIGIANPTTKFHIDGAASALIANLDANVSVAKSISFRSDNSNRINLEVSGTESGSNAGADFFLRAYSDAGALLNTPLTIVRSTGNATFIGTVAASNGTLIGGGGTTNYFSKFTNSTVIGNSAMYEGSAGKISINNTNTTYALEVHGEGRFYQPLTNTTAYFRVENNRSRNAALNLKTTVGDFLLGVGIGADTNQFQIYDNTASANRLTIASGGNVGIGTTTPNTKFNLVGNGTPSWTPTANNIACFSQTDTSGSIARVSIVSGNAGVSGLDFGDTDKDNDAGIFYSNATQAMTFTTAGVNNRLTITSGGVVQIAGLTSNGTVSTQSSNGSLYVSSDANLKIEDGFVENGLEKVLALKPRYFYWKDKESFSADRQLGFYAQEVNAVSEETANTPPEGCGWGIYDRGLVALLTSAIQEMNTKLDEQNQTIQSLQEQINILSK